MKTGILILSAVLLVGCNDSPRPDAPIPDTPTTDKSVAINNEVPSEQPESSVSTVNKEFHAEELSPHEEQRIINLAKTLKTADGSSVYETIKYAEKNSNGMFKVAKFEPIFNNDGSLYGVGMSYWVGESRHSNDVYGDVSWKLANDRQSYVSNKEENPTLSDEELKMMTGAHLMNGKEDFLYYVENTY